MTSTGPSSFVRALWKIASRIIAGGLRRGSVTAIKATRKVDTLLMSWMTLALAIYGAMLSTVLGYLTWRKDRHCVRFFMTQSRRGDWYGMIVSVVNAGLRPVTLNDVRFEQPNGQGYMNGYESNVVFPHRLAEGEQLVFAFHAEDIERDTTALVMQDTHRREHRMEFTQDVHNQLEAFRDFIREAEPRLYAEGQRRVAAMMRGDLEGIATHDDESRRNKW